MSMQNRKIKYHCHDDVEEVGKWIKFALCPFDNWTEEERGRWVDENIDFKWFRSVGEAICYYEESKDFPDILSVDIDCRELPSDYRLPENCRLPEKFSRNERSSTRGKALLEYAFSHFPESIIFYFTGQVDDNEVWPVVAGALQKGTDVKKKDKAKGPAVITVDTPTLLKKVAEKYLSQYMSPSNKHALREKVVSQSRHELQAELVNTSKGSFRFSHLTVGWLTQKNDDEFKRDILALLSANLTYAASECFGVDGVKQATHPLEQGYYKGSEGWHQKAIDQVNALKKAVEEGLQLLEHRDLALPFLNNYLSNLKIFEATLKSTGEAITPPVNNLQEAVRKNFRFGTSLNSTPIDFGLKSTGHNFEIYLPVHLVYQEQFKRLIDKCNGVTLHSYQTMEPHNRPICTWNENKTPKLHREYIVFEQTGTDEYPANVPGDILPDYFEVFRSMGFDLFGRMYLLLRRNGNPKLYDCTYSPCIEKELNILNKGLLQHEKGLKEYVEERINGVKAFFIFEFSGWRQP